MQQPRKPKMVSVPASDIDFIKQTLENLRSDVGDMKNVAQDVKDLKNAIVGNKDYGIKGVVPLLEEHDAYIDEDRKFKNKLIGGSIVGGLIWSYILKSIT